MNNGTTTSSTTTGTALLLSSIRDYIMKPYTFIGLVERMDESLAAMKHILNVDLGDLIVLSAKQSGGYDDGRYNNTCYLIKPKQEQQQSSKRSVEVYQQRIEEYISTDFRENNFDYILYDIVNASLDQTIEAIGRDKFDRTLQELRYMRKTVETECEKEEIIFPCSSNGTRQVEKSASNCYWFDKGCGYKCVDRVVESLSLVL